MQAEGMGERHTHACVIGAGRMGEGIALAFALAGQTVALIDLKAREATAQLACFTALRQSLDEQLGSLHHAGLLSAAQCSEVLARIALVPLPQAAAALVGQSLVFEALPERLEVKREGLGWLGQHVHPDAIIASTTSTFRVSELAAMLPGPQRVLVAHWLNPAHLMPLVEISRSPASLDSAVQRLSDGLQAIGKVPVVCGPCAGFIVPRLQALVMNEAARMVEEGVASVADIDTAVRNGLGLRFSVLGALEFIDWGGGDTLYQASHYLSGELGERFAPAPRVQAHFHAGRNGLRDGAGFYDYHGVDTVHYRQQRLAAFVTRLEQMGLLPRIA